MTQTELEIIVKATDDVIKHGYGHVEVVVKNGRVLHVRPTKDIMLAESPKTEER